MFRRHNWETSFKVSKSVHIIGLHVNQTKLICERSRRIRVHKLRDVWPDIRYYTDILATSEREALMCLIKGSLWRCSRDTTTPSHPHITPSLQLASIKASCRLLARCSLILCSLISLRVLSTRVLIWCSDFHLPRPRMQQRAGVVAFL